MEVLEPIKPRSDQEPLHFPTTEIVNVRVPVLMIAFARVLMFVQRRPIEPRHAVGVRREMRWYPIHDDADFGAMAGIHETGKTFGRPEPRAWCKQAKRLVAP